MGTRDDGAPILSAMAGEPEVRERLEAFVLGLGERVDQLQDLESERDWKALEADARRLGEEALALGFGPLCEAGAVVQHACVLAQERHPACSDAAVREALVALTDVARRVRLGHRGAML
ncbi:MAG TPA: hypothetical protein VKM54_23815 [Myxococcota bacterium]|nr:hypothetical protein [Myxococcota bacterium]